MSYLQKRQEKVERLTLQALKDKQPHKYIQGRFILDEIHKRMNEMGNYRTTFLTSLRSQA